MDGLTVGFPENVVSIVKEELAIDNPSWTVLARPLRPSDPNLSIGVFALDWQPTEYEIGGVPDPAIARYSGSIHSLVKHANEEEGVAAHTGIARRVRTMLYRDVDLRVRLQQEQIQFDDGTTESTSRYGLTIQRFRSNEIDGQFVYLSVTDFWIETQTV